MLTREIERAGIPAVLITALSALGSQLRANRVVTGVKIPTPCGDAALPEEADYSLRKEILRTALKALQTDVTAPTIFTPNVVYTQS